MGEVVNMPPIEISMAAIAQVDEYLFQMRTPESSNGAVGLIGCFGGSIEQGETPRKAMSRELAEETNLVVRPDLFHFLGTVEVASDRDGVPRDIHANVFKILLPQIFEVRAIQGSLVRIRVDELKKDMEIYTPATRKALEELL